MDVALSCLSEQAGSFEVIVILAEGLSNSSISPAAPTRAISSTGSTRGALLNDGAAASRGDVLLFLWPDCQLPIGGVAAVRRNLELLSQTIGGDFHVGFDDESAFSRGLTNFFKRWRYRGHYYGNSGIFVRRDAFEAIGGFGPDKILEDYQFARRMEKYGPTLYLPDTITASARKFRQRKIRAALSWVTAQALYVFGWHSEKVTRACLQTSR